MPAPDKQLTLDFDAPPEAQWENKRARDAEIKRLVSLLYAEFDRLNAKSLCGKYPRPTIEFSLRKSFGGYYQKMRHRIVLSWQAYVEHGWAEVMNTFRHEVAHIVHLNHSAEFWKLAAELGVTKKYASDPLTPRCVSTRLYIYACPACGGQIRRRRRIRNASCGRCDRKYNPKFKLVLVKSEQQSAR